MQRVLLPAMAALVVLGCAVVAVWIGLVHGVDAAVAEQARLAGEMLDAHASLGPPLANTLLRPGLHVRIADPRSGKVVDADDAGTVTHSMPQLVDRSDAAFASGPPLPGDAPPPPGIERPPLDVEPPPPGGRPPPLGPLAHVALSVAHVAERRAAAERYQRFLAETGHELRTPPTVMSGYVDILRARGSGAGLDERILEGMHAETARMRVLVEKMMLLARFESDAAVPRWLDLATAAREAAQTLQRRYPDSDVQVEARILVVDDEPNVCEMLEIDLAHHGFNARTD